MRRDSEVEDREREIGEIEKRLRERETRKRRERKERRERGGIGERESGERGETVSKKKKFFWKQY